MDRINEFAVPWEEQWVENVDSIPMRELGYAIEELRVSLFAPSVPTGMIISEQRLEKMMAKVL